uniref:beta strand repeat-containing protein n=1 Tax=uncultured Dialister sp. TaxID=278064 RepID=UPI00258F5333
MSTKTYFSIGRKGKLAMAILATLSAGFLFPSLARASTSSTEPITGDIKLTDDYSVNLSTGTGNYASKQGYSVLLTPKDDATINIDMSGHDLNLTASSSSLDAYGATITQGGTWNVTNGKGKTITISAEGKDNAYGINMLGTSIDVDANLHIVKAAGTNEAFGIYADMGSKNVFKGDVTIENVALTPDRHDGTYTAGIALWSTGSEDENTSVTVQGKTTIKNSGDAIQIGSKRDVLTLGAASLSINDNSVITDKYHAVTNTFGTVYINIARDGVTTGTTNIYGDIFSGSTTKTYLALTDADSTWVGSSDANWGADHVWHGTYLTLQNGATFTNKSLSKDSTHGSRKNWSGSFLNELTGGTSADKAGNIVMENAGTDPLRIQKISGNTNIFYSHEDNTPAAFSNGNVLIDEASKGANIRVITAPNGITTSDTTQVKNVLSALAEKIYYGVKNDTIGDDGKAGNLSGTVEIAEGLTSSSQSLKSTALLFNKDADTTVHYDSKRFKYEPSYHQGYASYEESTKQQNEYTIPITGDSTADALYGSTGVTSDYKNYTFSNNTGKVSIDSGSTPAVNVKNKNVTVDASALDQINLDSGIYVSGDKGKNVPASSASVAINGSKIQVHHTGSNVVHAYAGGTLALNGTGDFSADSDTVNAEGTIFYMQGSFPNRVNKASITLNGGSITATAGNALSATGSTIRINEDSKGQTLFNDVTIKGDIRESGLTVTSGTTGSAVDIALTTTPSSWTGVSVLDSSSTLNLLLQNGGTWINEKNSGTDSSFTGSHITTLTGGSAGKAGIIFQNDTNPITVDSYSGNSTVIYKHNADDPTSITGGTFTITKADKDSAITLLTDNSGIDMKSTTADARNRVSEVLNKLAQKLFYTGYTDGNLKGTVEIADGLTASSASLKTGDISYSTATTGTKTEGQGYYDYSPAEDIPSEQTDTEFGQQITGDETKDGTYIKAGVLKKGTNPALYKFTKDTTITLAADGTDSDSEKNNGIIRLDGKNADVDATGHTVKLVVPSSTSAGQTPSGIIISGNSNLDFKGNADVSVTGESKAVGVRIPGASLMDMMNPDVVHGGTAVFENGLTVKAKVKTGYAPYDVEDNQMGLYVGYKNSSITVKGTTDIDVTSASETNAYGVTVADSEATKADIKDSAVINLNGDTTIKLHTSHNAYALYAKGGQINVNYDGTGAGTAKVNIDGDLYAVAAGTDESSYPASNTYGEINLALTGSSSSWNGVVENASGKHGDVNLWLTDGAVWTSKASGQLNSDNSRAKDYEKYSYLTTLHGGSTTDKAGIIDMTQGTRGISVGNYSGNTLVVYKHEITDDTSRAHADLYGNKAANVIGGSFKITDAAAGSTITLVTDSTGVSTTSTSYTDKNLVNDLLDKLANKLYYSGYANGKLKGYVRIAEGLTSSSITAKLRQEDISFYTADEAKTAGMTEGQGHYIYKLSYPDEQQTDKLSKVILGFDDRDTYYKEQGILQSDGIYHFTKPETTISIDGAADSAEQKRALVYGDNWVAASIYSAISGARPQKTDAGEKISADGQYSNVVMDLGGNKLNVDVNWTGG